MEEVLAYAFDRYPKQYAAIRICEPIEIDGDLTKPVWNRAWCVHMYASWQFATLSAELAAAQ